MDIQLKDIKLTPVLESAHRERLTDQEYFSKAYSHYVSNSRLGWIHPDKGSPETYKKGGDKLSTTSLNLGSAVHELFLQKDEFELGPSCDKPSAKLGMVLDQIIIYRRQGLTIIESIKKACIDIDYYTKSLSNFRIKSIISSGLKYYINYKNIKENIILLPNKDREICINCISNLNNNKKISSLVNPVDMFGDPIISYNEDALFIDITGSYEDKTCALGLKMKADNWTIDVENKIITLNDLKTTGHMLSVFMKDSFHKFHYSRQLAMYSWILSQYCKKEYGYNSKEWTINCNIIAVETCLDNRAGVFSISPEIIKEGKKEFCRLLKMVAYYEMFGYDSEVNFV